MSVTLDKVQDENTYKTASGGSLLDATIEDMANGDFFDAHGEAQAIENHWTNN